jgi:D-alanyl-D-alanine dipeptidase
MSAFSSLSRRAAITGFVCAVLFARCSTVRERPPVEPGPFRQADLVEIVKLDPAIHLDVRYATPNNFTGQPVYRQARAFLQRPAAEALVRVNRSLRGKGYGLLVFDGYRPWSVTKHFWEITPEDKREKGFVANPAKGSKHNRGAAVDLSMYDIATGKEVGMPSAYDEFTDRADPDYAGGTSEQRSRRDLLRAEMEKEGFSVDPGEWWHFNYKGWQEYPILDIPFEKIP